jgi:hypothetical protein
MNPSLLLQQTTSHIAALDDEDLPDLAAEVDRSQLPIFDLQLSLMRPNTTPTEFVFEVGVT